MKYEPLSHLYYSDKDNFNKIYKYRYNSEFCVHLDFYINENKAFFMLMPELFETIIDLHIIDKDIQSIIQDLPGKSIEQFTKRCLIDEIILTNNIEGVYSTRKEVETTLQELQFEDKHNRFKGLISKYFMLMNKTDISLDSSKDIRNIYDELVLAEISEDTPDNIPDGIIFRKGSVSVTSPTDKEIHRGLNPESNIIASMDKAIKLLKNDKINILFRIAIFHYLFGYIHPFYDGNGRTSRFISSYLLSKTFVPLIGYRLSYTIKENINNYYKAFKICNHMNNLGDLTPFIFTFLDIVKKSMLQLREALEKRALKLYYYQQNIKLLPKTKKGANFDLLYNLLIQAALFSDHGIPTMDLIDMIKISRRTLSNRLNFINNFDLLIKEKIGPVNYYSLDLNKFNEIIISQKPSK